MACFADKAMENNRLSKGARDKIAKGRVYIDVCVEGGAGGWDKKEVKNGVR
jgi:hypothetical protein